MDADMILRFERWGDDHVEVLCVDGNCQLNGVPFFHALPYGRYIETSAGEIASLSYYPPFSHDPEGTRTRIVVRAPKSISEDIVAEITKGCISAGRSTYEKWREQYGHSTTDTHLSTISKISK